jgi:hypothetical protein
MNEVWKENNFFGHEYVYPRGLDVIVGLMTQLVQGMRGSDVQKYINLVK